MKYFTACLAAIISSVIPAQAQAPFPVQESSLEFFYSPSSDLSGDEDGEAQVTRYTISHSVLFPVSKNVRALTGLSLGRTDIDLKGPSLLPDELQEISLSLGLMANLEHSLGTGWSGQLFLRPGFFSDSSSISSSDFTASGALFASYKYSDTLTLNFGIAARLESEAPVIPFVGGTWQFADNWKFTLAVPRTDITYDFSSDLTFRAGVKWESNSYFANSNRESPVNEEWLSFREFQLGLGAIYSLNKNCSIALDAGIVVGREFDFHDDNFQVDADSTSFVSATLKARF